MYKSKEFDYDLWTTQEGGTKHYWARVKATGEVAEISIEVMRFLRAEDTRRQRSNGQPAHPGHQKKSKKIFRQWLKKLPEMSVVG